MVHPVPRFELCGVLDTQTPTLPNARDSLLCPVAAAVVTRQRRCSVEPPLLATALPGAVKQKLNVGEDCEKQGVGKLKAHETLEENPVKRLDRHSFTNKRMGTLVCIRCP